jgi:hypothetical protein
MFVSPISPIGGRSISDVLPYVIPNEGGIGSYEENGGKKQKQSNVSSSIAKAVSDGLR